MNRFQTLLSISTRAATSRMEVKVREYRSSPHRDNSFSTSLVNDPLRATAGGLLRTSTRTEIERDLLSG